MTTQSFIVGIAGGSASGKTTFARVLKSLVPERYVALITLDSYYRARDGISLSDRDKINYDHPDALELNLLASHLATLRAGESVNIPEYDFAQHNRRAGVTHVIAVRPLIIVEGILTLHSPEVRKHFDCTVFVDAPTSLRLERRIARDIRERGRTRDSVLWQWNDTVEPMYQEFCEPTKKFASMIIDGSKPELDKMHEILRIAREKVEIPDDRG